MPKLKLPQNLTRFIALMVGKFSRFFKRGGGTSLPGKVAMQLRPSITAELGKRLSLGSVLVSATNGKTTTTNLLANILQKNGLAVVSNPEGANLLSGITTALIKNLGGKNASNTETSSDSIGIFEVDEAVLPIVIEALNPQLLILSNLFRDQLDRHGELEQLISRWKRVIGDLSPEVKVLANADDPLIMAVLKSRKSNSYENVSFFGLGDPSVGRKNAPSIKDNYNCRECSGELLYELWTIGDQGWWKCSICDWKRPKPDFLAEEVELMGLEGVGLKIRSGKQKTSFDLQLPGLHNVYNATAAISGAMILGIKPEDIQSAMENVGRSFGRFEEILIASTTEDEQVERNQTEAMGAKIFLMLAKNPVSVNENLFTLSTLSDSVSGSSLNRTKDSSKPDMASLNMLVILNDGIADGRDVSWIWDVDYEMILPAVKSVVISGNRAGDMALRWLYGGFPSSKIQVEPDLRTAFRIAHKNLTHQDLEHEKALTEPKELFVMVTYTALLQFRKILEEEKLVKPYWKSTTYQRIKSK